MQSHYRISSQSIARKSRIKFTIRDNWLDDSAPMFEIEARAKSVHPEDAASSKLFIERAVIDVNKSSVMVEQGHGGTSSHLVSHHRGDREIQRELVHHVSTWVSEVADILEMALEGEWSLFDQEMQGRMTSLETFLEARKVDEEEGIRDRCWMTETGAKAAVIMLRMNCSSALFLMKHSYLPENVGKELLHQANRVFNRMAERYQVEGDPEMESLSSQAVSIISRCSNSVNSKENTLEEVDYNN